MLRDTNNAYILFLYLSHPSLGASNIPQTTSEKHCSLGCLGTRVRGTDSQCCTWGGEPQQYNCRVNVYTKDNRNWDWLKLELKYANSFQAPFCLPLCWERCLIGKTFKYIVTYTVTAFYLFLKTPCCLRSQSLYSYYYVSFFSSTPSNHLVLIYEGKESISVLRVLQWKWTLIVSS